MSDSTRPSGNPVFDFKAGFRAAAQSIQRILLWNGVFILAVCLAAQFVPLKNLPLKLTFQYGPLLGLGSIVLSTLWGLGWRGYVRDEFRKRFTSF